MPTSPATSRDAGKYKNPIQRAAFPGRENPTTCNSKPLADARLGREAQHKIYALRADDIPS
jgi:hypothetical protein